MSTLVIELNEGYIVPDVISKLTKKEWAYVLEFITAMLKTHEFKGYEEATERDRREYDLLLERVERDAIEESRNAKALKEKLEEECEKRISDIKSSSITKMRELEEECEKRISDIKSSLQTRFVKDKSEEIDYINNKYDNQIKDLKDQLAKMRNIEDEHEKKLTEQRELIYSRFNKEREEEVSILSSRLVKQEKELNEQLARFRNVEEEYGRKLSEQRELIYSRINKEREEEVYNLSSKLSKKEKEYNEQMIRIRNLEDEYESKLLEQKALIQSKISKDKDDEIRTLSSKLTKQEIDLAEQILRTKTQEEEHEKKLTEQRELIYSRFNKEREEEVSILSSKLSKKEKEYNEQLTRTKTQEEEYEKSLSEQKSILQARALKDKSEELTYINNKYEMQIKELKEFYSKLTNDLREEADRKRIALEKELEEKSTLNDTFLQTHMNNTSLQEQLEDIKRVAMKGNDAVLSHGNKFEQLTSLLTPVAKFYSGSNSDKGNGGENIIHNILLSSENYNDAIIEDVSGQTASGDIYFAWRQLKCMIEVKNKKTITKEDMSKFERDVTELSNNKKINCAMMISLQTNIFPSQTRNYIKLSIIENTPVIYSYLSNMNDIHYAISCLEQVVMSNAVANNRSIKMITYFLNYYEYMKLSQGNLEKTITNKQRELKGLFKQLETVNKSLEGMTHDYISVSSSLAQPQEENTDEDTPQNTNETISVEDDEKVEKLDLTNEKQSLNTIIHTIINRSILGKSVSTSSLISLFNITPSYLEKLGGYKSIVLEAREKYTASIITKPIVEKLISYKKENSSYPSRAFITKNIITDSSLRKLAKVVKTKTILEYIFDYCEKL